MPTTRGPAGLPVGPAAVRRPQYPDHRPLPVADRSGIKNVTLDDQITIYQAVKGY